MDGVGNIFVAEANPGLQFNALRKISANGIVSTITGTLARPGAADGAGPAARFSIPHGLAVDATGVVWVADTGNQLIRQISANGVVTTLAGATGYATLTEPGDGKGSLARFFQPLAVAVDSHGTAFVADAVHNTVRKVLSDGTVTTLAGKVRGYGAIDGVGSAAIFSGLAGITIDRTGILYVSDMAAVRRVDPTSGAVTTLAGQLGPSLQGSADGAGAAARFAYLPAITVDSAGNLYVVDSVNNNVRKITPNGVVTTLAGKAGVTGSADGQGAAASFNRPQGIAVDGTGNVYVADTDNNLIRRITPAGVVTTIAGQFGANGNVPGALNNPLSQPTGLAFDANGILYVCASNGIFQLHL
jgi:sugar lactone lactonase YvrE